MDALELSLRCTNLLMRSMKKDSTGSAEGVEVAVDNEGSDSSLPPVVPDNEAADSMDESDCEKHFADQGTHTCTHNFCHCCLENNEAHYISALKFTTIKAHI